MKPFGKFNAYVFCNMTDGPSKLYVGLSLERVIYTEKIQPYLLYRNRENHISPIVLRTDGQKKILE